MFLQYEIYMLYSCIAKKNFHLLHKKKQYVNSSYIKFFTT